MPKKIVDGHIMRLYADMLKTVVPEGYGFALIIFEFHDEFAMSNYISNARREDMIKALEIQLASLKGGKDFMTPNSN